MTFRFEEEDFEHIYVLEDFYPTNPFAEEEFMVVSFRDDEDSSNRISFILTFNRSTRPLPNYPKLTPVQSNIVKNWVKEIPNELMVLLKQRAMEAKAYGEKNPMSYLEFAAERYTNFLEMFPSMKENLVFTYEDEKYFAEDHYRMDPREKNRDVKLFIYKLDLNETNQAPVFSYTYHFNEKERSEEDARLKPEHNEMLVAMNQAISSLYEILKKRYRDAKKLGEELMKQAPPEILHVNEKLKPNEMVH
ncbi:MAG: hypothetical protein COV67_05400 [Nitrospinae bacterium CG11_big_fil_rev_8_21_14_0_20_56_8]|nr:MAG: hypothetical protein COV67_05400 [Nitrospinae bacterium CG11_big_fil_rev_8_21_14_0_20_56_8]